MLKFSIYDTDDITVNGMAGDADGYVLKVLPFFTFLFATEIINHMFLNLSKVQAQLK